MYSVSLFLLLNSFQVFGPHTGLEFECAKLGHATGKTDILNSFKFSV